MMKKIGGRKSRWAVPLKVNHSVLPYYLIFLCHPERLPTVLAFKEFIEKLRLLNNISKHILSDL